MDQASFAQLYMEQLPGLYRLALSILHSESDAEDAVQQAAVNAWRARERLRPGGERAYLTRVLINASRDIQRSRMHIVLTDDFEDAAEDPPDGTLRAALDSLPEKLRTPLLLMYMEGWHEREIASALHITQYAVKSRLRRGRAALAQLMKEEEA